MSAPRFQPGIRLGVALLVGTLSVNAPLSAAERRGEALADACTSCHGLGGHSRGYIPSIDALSRDAFVQALKGYRAQTKPATIMNRIARAYADADIEALADYFTSGARP